MWRRLHGCKSALIRLSMKPDCGSIRGRWVIAYELTAIWSKFGMVPCINFHLGNFSKFKGFPDKYRGFACWKTMECVCMHTYIYIYNVYNFEKLPFSYIKRKAIMWRHLILMSEMLNWAHETYCPFYTSILRADYSCHVQDCWCHCHCPKI